jgi:hypothetical protein
MPKTAAQRTSPRRTTTPRPRRAIPLDDEPLTPADLKAIAEADAAYARGDYYTLEEAKQYVARLRSKARSKKSRPVP